MALKGRKTRRFAQQMGVSFKGEYFHTVDAKGRLIIPVRFREALGERFVISMGFDRCLFIFDTAGWESFMEKLGELPLNKQGARNLGRIINAGAEDAETDKQGRILLPARHLEFAGIGKEQEAVIIGVGPRAEIWNADRWRATKSETDIDSIADALGDIGWQL